MAYNEVNTGKKLKLIETDDINKVPFEGGQYIIVDNGHMYYDPTYGDNINYRRCLNPKQEVDVHERILGTPDEYYLSLATKPINGDLVVIKDVIPQSNKCQYTIYIYNDNPEDSNSSEWCKLSESQNAKNIYFDSDILLTSQIGNVELNNGIKNISSTGKNLYEILELLLSTDVNPVVTQPSAIINFPASGTYEVGTLVTPSYDIEFNPGQYEFGPTTDVKATGFDIMTSSGVSKFTQNGSFNPIEIKPDTDFYLVGIITHSAGTTPLTLKGKDYDEGSIKVGAITASTGKIKGYVNGLYFGCSNDLITNENVTNDIIKTLPKSNKAYEIEDINMIVPVGTKSIIIACPVLNTGITNIYNNTASVNMLQAFGQPTVIKVAGADNDLESDYAFDYNVWIYNPANEYEYEAKLTITLS